MRVATFKKVFLHFRLSTSAMMEKMIGKSRGISDGVVPVGNLSKTVEVLGEVRMILMSNEIFSMKGKGVVQKNIP